MIWTYRLLAVLNAPLLALAVFMAFAAMTVFGLFDLQAILIRLACLAWPIPQVVGYLAARRAKRSGRLERACWILAIQFVGAGAITGGYLAWVLQ